MSAIDPNVFYTRTLARVFVSQGNWRKAEEIYRHLLTREPGNLEISAELEAIGPRLQEMRDERLVELFSRWMDLAFSLARIRRLRRLPHLLDGDGFRDHSA